MSDPGGHAVWQGRFLEAHVAPWGEAGQWEYVKRARGIQAAVIIALTGAHEIVLVEQYRPPLGRACIELPAGLVGDETEGEEIFASAQRELHEETGFEAREWEEMKVPLGELRLELTQTEKTMNQIADTATTGFADAITDSFLSAAKGAESFGDSFRRMAASVIESMARIAIQSALTNTLIPAFTNSVGLTASPAPRPGGPAAPTPITTSAPKSMPAMGGAAKSKAAIVVNVNNSAPGVTAQAYGSEGPSGPQIDVVVASVVSSDLDRGGPISRTLARTHGVQRKGRRG
jgi:hypothetical protein